MTDNRIIGHLTLCFIALICEAYVTKALREAEDNYNGTGIIKPRQLSAVTTFRELADVRAIPVRIGKQMLWIRTDIEGHVAILFKRLGIRIPPKLLKTECVVAQEHAELVSH